MNEGSGDPRRRQGDVLADRRLDLTQRQLFAAEIGSRHGNLYLDGLLEDAGELSFQREISRTGAERIQRDPPPGKTSYVRPPGSGLRAPRTHAERASEYRPAHLESVRADLRQEVIDWMRENWTRTESRIRLVLSVPGEEPHEHGWDTVFLLPGSGIILAPQPAILRHHLMDVIEYLLDKLNAVAPLAGGVYRSQWDGFISQFEVLLDDLDMSTEAVDHRTVWGFATSFIVIHERLLGYARREFAEAMPGAETPAARGHRALTREQLAQLQQLAREMNYSEIHLGYTDLNRWLAGQRWLGRIKTGISSTNDLVDGYYGLVGTDRPDAGFLSRLKLASKLISNKGRLDKLMMFFYAGQRVQGAQDQAYFNCFLQYWDANGWTGMLDLYNELRGDRPAITVSEEEYLSGGLSNDRRAEIGLTIGRFLAIDRRVAFAAIAAGIFETLDITTTLHWFVLEEAFLNRIPGWAQLKLGVSGLQALVQFLREEPPATGS